MNNYRHIQVNHQDGVACVRLKNPRLEELEIQQVGQEMIDLCQAQGCHKVALSLGPQTPDCLYSVFLAKLVSIRNTLHRAGGEFVLCEVSPVAMTIFAACALDREFIFAPDFEAALTILNEKK